MNLVQLRYFVAVARSKSLTRAAMELRIAQPAISRQLKLLEDELGAILLRRHQKGVELTDAGRILLDKASFKSEASIKCGMSFGICLSLRPVTCESGVRPR